LNRFFLKKISIWLFFFLYKNQICNKKWSLLSFYNISCIYVFVIGLPKFLKKKLQFLFTFQYLYI
jgi:hypothetical protein